MKTLLVTTICLMLFLSFGTVCAIAQNGDMAASADKTPPSYDMKPQALLDLEGVQKKFASLAEAMPADKFNWRPSADSRSFAEVMMHVAAARYQIMSFMGATPPSGFDPKVFEKSTTDKTQIIEALNKSWDFVKGAMNGMTNADFAKLLPKLGPQANAGDVVYILVADNHEHLGQAIAYARVNGVVPPWTVEAQKKAAEKKAEQK